MTVTVRRGRRRNHDGVQNDVHNVKKEADDPDTDTIIAHLQGLLRVLFCHLRIAHRPQLVHIVLQHTRVNTESTRAQGTEATAATTQPPENTMANPANTRKTRSGERHKPARCSTR